MLRLIMFCPVPLPSFTVTITDNGKGKGWEFVLYRYYLVLYRSIPDSSLEKN